jgi:hypothetical protein
MLNPCLRLQHLAKASTVASTVASAVAKAIADKKAMVDKSARQADKHGFFALPLSLTKIKQSFFSQNCLISLD